MKGLGNILTRSILASIGIVVKLELGAFVVLAAVLELEISCELELALGDRGDLAGVDLPLLTSTAESLDKQPGALSGVVLVVGDDARKLDVIEVACCVRLLEASGPHRIHVCEVGRADTKRGTHCVNFRGACHQRVDREGIARRGEEKKTDG